ncbi:MAG: prephenate dehydrogenase/arogenate dehydrogenase family protein [Thaumarchaeota archaeon]|nr:prephenate dehydrogenase/arogenate dehydrogenase family protein [Nitrososphaerota archaeon]
MRIAVLGSAGAMGSFFVRYFASQGHDVVGSDPQKGGNSGKTIAAQNAQAIRNADFVLVATPIQTTVTVCKQVLPNLRKGAVLVEISSVKSEGLVQVNKGAERKGLSFLSIHPLFGPALISSKGMKIAVVRRGRDSSMALARKLFPGARLFPMSAETHNKLMGAMLSLTHITNMAYAKVVASVTRPNEFRKMATPTSFLQLTLAESVLSQDPSLYSYVQTGNKFSAKLIRSMAGELLAMSELIESGDARKFEKYFVELARLYPSNGPSVKKVYDAFYAISN